MNLSFNIKYKTVWGETIKVILDENENNVIELYPGNNDSWSGTGYTVPAQGQKYITYRYGVYSNGKLVRKEFGAIPHCFYLGNAQQSHYIIDDCWRDLPADAYRYSSAFNHIYHCSPYRQLPDSIGNCITFRALCPGLDKKNQSLGLSGNCSALGNWAFYDPVRLTEIHPNVWHVSFPASSFNAPFEYKFVAINNATGAIEEWEAGENRIFNIKPLLRGETYVCTETEVLFDEPINKIAGSAIPVFSLRSKGSCGIGDFGDLKTYIDWAAKTHQRAVQILPIYDTTMTGTWLDSYPYNSISIYAFNPIYIDLRQLNPLADEDAQKLFEAEREKLNSLPQLDYEKVYHLKRNFLESSFHQDGKKILSSEEFQIFYTNNEDWLKPYAAFSYLRDLYSTSDFNWWPKYSTYKEDEIDELCDKSNKAYPYISFYYFLQYILHIQLLDAANHARKCGVIFKGDIPIGISRGSVEAWLEPHYFNMNGQAGAPPDAFSVNGQNWGFPTYNWEVMEKDNYKWWRRRFAKMAEYFTAYRIDHILGFFRIWEIPSHSVHGLLGQFAPSRPMSVDEIRSFGINFRKSFMTRPYIDDRLLISLFGEDHEYVRNKFLLPYDECTYMMHPDFDTQRKVESYFYNHKEEKQSLKEGLYSLISNVLFVEDHKEEDMYHPRIAVQNDYIFRQLSSIEQENFNNLYNHYYYQRHNEFWYNEAMKKLPVLTQSTPMLVCGEDLGMVPGCVPWLMKNLQILSLEIQRMPKAMWCEFGNADQYPFHSVCTFGTHDMSTLRGWWKEDAKATERFYHDILGHTSPVPEDITEELCEEVISQHLQSPSLLCILSWQDWTSIDGNVRNPDIEGERINIPANPRHYWRWRMHIPLEDLLEMTEFNEKIKRLIDDNGRY